MNTPFHDFNAYQYYRNKICTLIYRNRFYICIKRTLFLVNYRQIQQNQDTIDKKKGDY